MAEILAMLVGLVLLVVGAELLVRFSSLIASRLGIPPLVIGLTIVSFGTSAPELVASVAAALRQSPGLAVGNIVGSNIANGLLVAGVTALVLPIAVSRAALKRDGAIALGAAVVFWIICALQALATIVGAALLLGLVAYVFFSYRSERDAPDAGGASHSVAGVPSDTVLNSPVTAVIVCIVGIGLLAFGGRLLVDAAAGLAAGVGVSEAVVGLTIVAVGTSLPELATSVTAALRGKADIAIGNIIGSNIFNILGIGGVTAMLSQGAIPSRIIGVDIPIMIGVTVVLLLFAATGHRIGRREGALLTAGFCVYTAAAWLLVA